MEMYMNPMYNMTEEKTDNGENMIIVDIDDINVGVAYVLNKYNECTSTVIYPKSTESLLRLKLKYDNRYSRISNDTWIAKFTDMSARITLVEREGYEFFVWAELYPY